MNAKWIKLQLRLLALKAIPEIEQKAVEWYLQHGEKIVGKAKDGLALDAIMKAYGLATSSVPGLNLTTLDDDLVRKAAREALDWAWAEIGDLINDVSKPPVTDDTTLPTGGLK